MVIHNAQKQRFEIEKDGKMAELVYRVKGDRISLVHTGVPLEIQRQGVGAELAKAALDYAREHQLTVIPLCPYVGQYLRRHPEYQEIVDSSYRKQA